MKYAYPTRVFNYTPIETVRHRRHPFWCSLFTWHSTFSIHNIIVDSWKSRSSWQCNATPQAMVYDEGDSRILLPRCSSNFLPVLIPCKQTHRICCISMATIIQSYYLWEHFPKGRWLLAGSHIKTTSHPVPSGLGVEVQKLQLHPSDKCIIWFAFASDADGAAAYVPNRKIASSVFYWLPALYHWMKIYGYLIQSSSFRTAHWVFLQNKCLGQNLKLRILDHSYLFLILGSMLKRYWHIFRSPFWYSSWISLRKVIYDLV